MIVIVVRMADPIGWFITLILVAVLRKKLTMGINIAVSGFASAMIQEGIVTYLS
jgi:hypothetical protein